MSEDFISLEGNSTGRINQEEERFGDGWLLII